LKTDRIAETENEYPRKSALRENIEAILVAIVIALFIRTFVVQAFKIPSGSMKQTLQIGDHILVNKFIYGLKIPYLRKNIIAIKKPNRGDIVVFKYPVDPSKDFIKRVIGIPGDVIEIRDKKLYVNQERINLDSRFWGFVDYKAVNGKAFIIYWSWDKENFGVRWGRLGRLLK
jgi:signal peptidase I